MDKLYCYVDESGQDTRGEIFVVAVVLLGGDRDEIRRLCEAIESETGKGRVKWIRSRYDRRVAYARRILQESILKGKLGYSQSFCATDYLSLTVQTVAKAVVSSGLETYRVTVFIDGLPRSQYREVGNRLRQLGIAVKKVRGVKQDENDALIRLADAMCGLVRAATEGQAEMLALVERGKRNGYVKEL